MKKSHKNEADYWDRRGIWKDDQGEAALSLTDELRQAIKSGKRSRPMKNFSIKMDPAFLIAAKKIATRQAISYQSLIRSWIAKGLSQTLPV